MSQTKVLPELIIELSNNIPDPLDKGRTDENDGVCLFTLVKKSQGPL